VLDDMMAREDGSLPKPDRYTFNTVLKGLSSLGDLNAVMDLYRGMQRFGVSPDAITVNTMVEAAVSVGNLNKASQLLSTSGVAASVEGYSALLEGFVKKGDLKQVRSSCHACSLLQLQLLAHACKGAWWLCRPTRCCAA
jgi:pentatricopeptide repeat protein